jgi:hypothetical protein
MMINYLARDPYKVVAFDSIGDAGEWLNGLLPQPMDGLEARVAALADAKPIQGSAEPLTPPSAIDMTRATRD